MTANLSMSREDHEKIRVLLTEAVTVLCKNGLKFTSHINVDGLLGITVDDADVFLVKICESINKTQESPQDFSQVAQLLGAAKANYGLSISSVSSAGTPVPMTTFNLQGGKDHNDNHAPGVINITPMSGRSLLSPRTVNAKRLMMDQKSADEPLEKRAHLSTSSTSEGWQLTKDNPDDVMIKSEPMDSDEEQPRFAGMKTLGVISTVRSETPYSDSADEASNGEGYAEQQAGEPKDGVLAALRAALIHKLANYGTPAQSKQCNNNNNNNPKYATRQQTPYNPRKTRNPSKETPDSELVTLKCLMCTYETKRRYNFIRHMRGHSKSYAIYACDLCGDRFHSEEELGTHGLEAHKGHHLTCDQCGMTFMSERGKNIHAKTHKMMPIPDKKTVECETQCNDHEMDETLARHGAIDSQGTKSYSALRSQLSASSMVIRYPVLNGHIKPNASEDEDVDVETSENSSSKACGTSTSTSTSTETMTETKTTTPTSAEAKKETGRKASAATGSAAKSSTSSAATATVTATTSKATAAATAPAVEEEEEEEEEEEGSDENDDSGISASTETTTGTSVETSTETKTSATTVKDATKEATTPKNTTTGALSSLLATASATTSGSAKKGKGKKVRASPSPVPESRKEKSRKQDSTQIIRVIQVMPVKTEPEEAT